MCFFRRQNSEILRPLLPAVWKPQFFLKGNFEIGETPPPPFDKKFRNILSFFYDKIPIDLVCPPFWQNYPQIPNF